MVMLAMNIEQVKRMVGLATTTINIHTLLLSLWSPRCETGFGFMFTVSGIT